MFLLQYDKIWGRMDNKAFILNDVAAVMWQRIATGKAKEEIISEILAKYEVDRTTADKDLRSFVSSIRKLSLMKGHKLERTEKSLNESEIAGQHKKYSQPKIHIYDIESDEEEIIL
jgi:hypothetical protein